MDGVTTVHSQPHARESESRATSRAVRPRRDAALDSGTGSSAADLLALALGSARPKVIKRANVFLQLRFCARPRRDDQTAHIILLSVYTRLPSSRSPRLSRNEGRRIGLGSEVLGSSSHALPTSLPHRNDAANLAIARILAPILFRRCQRTPLDTDYEIHDCP